MPKKNLLSQEKGSMAIYAIATILCFIILLGGVFFSSSVVRKSQLRTLLKIKDIYAEQVRHVSEIAETRKELDVSGYAQNGLVLFYDGINNSGNGHSETTNTWTDLSELGNNGTLTNMQENGKNSWRENSLHFDGKDDVVIVPYQSSLAPNEYTIELVLSRSEVLNNNRSIVFVKWRGYTIELNANQTVSFGGNSTPYLNPTDILDLNEKYHITATFKDNVQKLYINGIQVAEKTISGTLSQTQTDLTIGGWTAAVNDPFAGNIYSVRMYNRELTAQEIDLNYNLDQERYDVKGYVKDGMVLHYDAINNTGKGHDSTTTVWKDLSGNGNDVTLTGFDGNSTSGWETAGLKFDGIDSYINTKSSQQFAGKDITIQTVINPTEGSNYRGIWGQHAGTANGGTDGLLAQFNNGNMTIGFGNDIATIDSNKFLNKTVLLTAVMKSGEGTTVYVNNEMVGQTQNKTSITNYGEFWIGKSYASIDRYFKGTMSTFLFYDKALTQEEVLQNYRVEKNRFELST